MFGVVGSARVDNVANFVVYDAGLEIPVADLVTGRVFADEDDGRMYQALDRSHSIEKQKRKAGTEQRLKGISSQFFSGQDKISVFLQRNVNGELIFAALEANWVFALDRELEGIAYWGSRNLCGNSPICKIRCKKTMNKIEITSQEIRKTIERFANVIRAENLEGYDLLNVLAGEEIISRLSNINNQIIFGRRGTGKTHLLLALRDKLIVEFSEQKRVPIYIDLRKILPLLANANSDSTINSVLIFKYLINEIVAVLIENIAFIYEENPVDRDQIFENFKQDQVKQLLASLNLEFDGRKIKKLGDLELNEEEIKKLAGSLKASVKPEAFGSLTSELKNIKSEKMVKYISFADISNLLSKICETLGNIQIFCLLDEWSEIPIDVQPFLSELLKRSFIASKYVFKIAAIPYRTQLRTSIHGHDIGLEDGGDIFNVNVDNRYVYEINKQHTRDFYNELLFKHMRALNPQLFEDLEEGVPPKFINEFFATQALSEILIASAGVHRDFINLFINSYDRFVNTAKTQYKRIIVKNVRLATVEWYNSDKREQVEKKITSKRLLEEIVNEIIRKKKKTHFLLPQKYSHNPYFQQLVDLRVIHIRQRGYSHKGVKGAAYDVYSIDYGCYTSLNISKSELDTTLLNQIEQIETIEDFRQVRRISIEEDFIDKFLLEIGDAIYCPHCGKVVDTNHLAFAKRNLCNHCFELIENQE